MAKQYHADIDTDTSESNHHDFIEIQNVLQFITRVKNIEKLIRFFLFFARIVEVGKSIIIASIKLLAVCEIKKLTNVHIVTIVIWISTRADNKICTDLKPAKPALMGMGVGMGMKKFLNNGYEAGIGKYV